MAAPQKYNADYHDDWAWSLAIKGATNEEIAEAFGISERTVIRWQADHPSFALALARGKDSADAKVERTLYERAIGFETEETEKIVDVDANGMTKPVRVKTTKKRIAPDTMAIMYWLNNRKRNTGEWSQKQDIKISGELNTGPDLSKLTDNELRSLIRAYEDEN